MFFLSLAYSLFTCSECSAELGLFSSIGWSYDENFIHLCFISHNSNWGGGGIKEFPLFIYPYDWVLIFSDILLICFGEKLKQFFTGIPWKNLRVQNFSILQFWKDLLKQFSTGTLWKWVLEYYQKKNLKGTFSTNYIGVLSTILFEKVGSKIYTAGYQNYSTACPA